MALVIDGGTTGASATYGAVGPTEVITTGVFDGAKVASKVAAESPTGAPLFSFQTPGAILVQTAVGTKIEFSIISGGANTAIDVTCN
jgi:hypothetical protein